MTFFGSAAVRTLLRIRKQIEDAGSLLVVRPVSPTVARVLEITRLDDELDMLPHGRPGNSRTLPTGRQNNPWLP